MLIRFFAARRMRIARYMLCGKYGVCLSVSVCLSVILVYCIETAEHHTISSETLAYGQQTWNIYL